MNQLFAYIRVSSRDQNIDRQLEAIKEFNIPKRNIFIEKMSGKDFNSPQYKKLIKNLKNGDLLYVKSIDRLAKGCHCYVYQLDTNMFMHNYVKLS